VNKQQRDYLILKVKDLRERAILDFKKSKPTRHTNEEKIAALKKAGFIEGDNNFRYAPYLSLKPTAQHIKNEELVENYTAKVSAVASDTIDAIHLSDSPDALQILKDFTKALQGVK